MTKTYYIAALSLLLAAAGPAHATVIGMAVNADGSALPNLAADSVDGDGSINFYIPLKTGSSGTFGVDAGTSSDTCSFSSGTCQQGGTLDMYLSFAPTTPGANILSLDFIDFDLIGVNDPWNFLESVDVRDTADSDNLLYSIDNVADANGTDLWITADGTDQLLQMAIDIVSNSFLVHLTFASSFTNLPGGTWGNTRETMLATVDSVSVPEPTTLSLLGAGLIAIGLSRRRRAQPVTAA